MIEEISEVTNGLLHLRSKYGADTPLGHRCSNVI